MATASADEVLHHHEARPARSRPEVKDLDDIGVADSAGGPSLLLEATDHLGIAGDLRAKSLDSYPLVEGLMSRREDHSHGALAEDVLDHILALEDISYRDRARFAHHVIITRRA